METIQLTHQGIETNRVYNALKHSIRSAESSLEFFKSRLDGMETGNKMRLMQSIKGLEKVLNEKNKHIKLITEVRQMAWN